MKFRHWLSSHRRTPISYFALILLLTLSFIANADGHEWLVGPTRTYTLPSMVANLVSDGDTVTIDEGFYNDCATWNQNNLLLRGPSNAGATTGYAHLESAGCSDKGIWILFGNNTTIENIEFSGAVSTSYNGAGVRAQGGSFTIRHCYIHNNQMGVLASMTDSANVLIEHSVLAYNISPDESVWAHNIYINTCDTFILRYSYIHGAEVGHNVKSRAWVNFILYNRIMDQVDSASRDIDLPNGGQAFVIGNEIEKGPNAPNTNTLGFGLEGMINPGPQNLYVMSNTFVNDLPARGIYVTVPNSGFDTLEIGNNIFAGTGVLLSGTPAVLDTFANLIVPNVAAADLNDPANYDYGLPWTSPAIDYGQAPGLARGLSLTPIYEYYDTALDFMRPVFGAHLDAGAYEWGRESVGSSNPESSNRLAISVQSDELDRTAILRASRPIFGTVTVYDLLGRPMTTFEARGEQNISFSTNGLRSGVYMFRFAGLGMQAATQMTIVR